MTTTQSITREHAESLLRTTSTINLTGRIGSPVGSGYTLPQALGALARCTGGYQVETVNGLDILKADDVANGQHRWYITTEPTRNDPWS